MLDALCGWAAERPWLSSLLASREDFSGTVQDITACMAMLSFLFAVFLWNLGLVG